MKKNTKTLIISITAVVVLVGVFLLVKFLLPQQEDPKEVTNAASTSSEETSSEAPIDYHLISHVPADIEKIEVENELGKYTLLAETPTAVVTAEDGTASTVTETTIYTLVGYEDKDLLLGSPDMVANDAAAVEAGKLVNDGSKKSDFGFDSPRAIVNVTYTGGETAKIIVGNDAPDNQGAYVMVNDDKNVYLVLSDAVDGFLIGAMNMLSHEIGFAADDDSGNVFTKMVLGGTLFGGEVVFEQANSEAFSETYRITSPDNVLANEEVVTYMMNNIRCLNADEVVAVDPDEEKCKELGLAEPYVTVEAEYPDLKVSYKASKPEDGSFNLLSGGIVYKLSTDSAPWIQHDYNECIVTSILRPKYGTVKEIKVEADGTEYDFVIDTQSATESDTTTTTMNVTCNGKAIDESKFNTYYQNLISAERCGGVEAIPDGKRSVLKVNFTFTNGETASAEYFESDNRKCPALMNGTLGTQAYESYVSKIVADTPKIAANQDVESVY